jgi:hypothetical protein
VLEVLVVRQVVEMAHQVLIQFSHPLLQQVVVMVRMVLELLAVLVALVVVEQEHQVVLEHQGKVLLAVVAVLIMAVAVVLVQLELIQHLKMSQMAV